MKEVSGGDRIPAELFKILKVQLLECCTQYASEFRKLSSGHSTGKGPFPFHLQRKGMPNIVQIAIQLHSFHTPNKLRSKYFKPGFNSM